MSSSQHSMLLDEYLDPMLRLMEGHTLIFNKNSFKIDLEKLERWRSRVERIVMFLYISLIEKNLGIYVKILGDNFEDSFPKFCQTSFKKFENS